MNQVSIATDLRLKPQSKTILRHLKTRHTISPLEAWGSYGIMRLAAAIFDIRKAGYTVDTTIKHDEAGKQYARYALLGA